MYSGDAYTPTYPRVEYKASAKAEKKVSTKYYELAKKIGYEEVRPLFQYVTSLCENGGKIVAFFEKNVLFDGDMVHKATSIHSRTDVGGLLNNISADAVIYVQNKNEFDNLVGMSDSISDAYKNKVKFVYDSLPHKKSAVKEKFS